MEGLFLPLLFSTLDLLLFHSPPHFPPHFFVSSKIAVLLPLLPINSKNSPPPPPLLMTLLFCPIINLLPYRLVIPPSPISSRVFLHFFIFLFVICPLLLKWRFQFAPFNLALFSDNLAHSFTFIPKMMSTIPCYLAFLLLPLGLFSHFCSAILCRNGVDLLGGPVADCALGRQCLNTTSAHGQTVYSCDFGGICETILNLRDGCLHDGGRKVCCCSAGDGCNFGPGGLMFPPSNHSSKPFGLNTKHLSSNVGADLKSSTALDFLKKLETGNGF